MLEQFDSSAPCLCCNEMILVRSRDWNSRTVALCMTCYESLPIRVIRMFFTMRCQIAALHHQVVEAQGNIKKLFSAQRDMEVALLNEG